MMVISNAIRLILLPYLAAVAKPLYLSKDAPRSIDMRLGMQLRTPVIAVPEKYDSSASVFAERDTTAASEWTFPVFEDGTRAIRNRKTGETFNITSVTDVSPEEARELGFPGWDSPESELALGARDPEDSLEKGDPSRGIPDPKTTLTKRDPVSNEHPGEALSQCHMTRFTAREITVRTVVDYQWRLLKIITTSRFPYRTLTDPKPTRGALIRNVDRRNSVYVPYRAEMTWDEGQAQSSLTTFLSTRQDKRVGDTNGNL